MPASNRRGFLAGAGALALARPALAQGAAGRVVVIGGGFAGATCARTLKRLDPGIAVTLVEANRTFLSCPFSNVSSISMNAVVLGCSVAGRE